MCLIDKYVWIGNMTIKSDIRKLLGIQIDCVRNYIFNPNVEDRQLQLEILDFVPAINIMNAKIKKMKQNEALKTKMHEVIPKYIGAMKDIRGQYIGLGIPDIKKRNGVIKNGSGRLPDAVTAFLAGVENTFVLRQRRKINKFRRNANINSSLVILLSYWEHAFKVMPALSFDQAKMELSNIENTDTKSQALTQGRRLREAISKEL